MPRLVDRGTVDLVSTHPFETRGPHGAAHDLGHRQVVVVRQPVGRIVYHRAQAIVSSADRSHQLVDFFLVLEIAPKQLRTARPEPLEAASLSAVGPDNRHPALEKISREVQTQPFAHAGHKYRLRGHGFRNSARVCMLSLKQPPRAVVLVLEFVSITPRDLTQ